MTDALTIAEAAARCGLPLSTLRYWEQIGLVPPVARDPSSGHRRYTAADVDRLETLANLRAVGLSLEDMRTYTGLPASGARDGSPADADRPDDPAAAARRRALFQAHADRLAAQVDELELRRRYLELKVRYWAAREVGDDAGAQAAAAALAPLIHAIGDRRRAPATPQPLAAAPASAPEKDS